MGTAATVLYHQPLQPPKHGSNQSSRVWWIPLTVEASLPDSHEFLTFRLQLENSSVYSLPVGGNWKIRVDPLSVSFAAICYDDNLWQSVFTDLADKEGSSETARLRTLQDTVLLARTGWISIPVMTAFAVAAGRYLTNAPMVDAAAAATALWNDRDAGLQAWLTVLVPTVHDQLWQLLSNALVTAITPVIARVGLAGGDTDTSALRQIGNYFAIVNILFASVFLF